MAEFLAGPRRSGFLALALVLLAAAGLSLPGTAHGATFTVNSATDTNDGTCDGTHCSLREAINAANALGGQDTIAFNIGGGGVQTISISSSNLTITSPLTIDGRTQPGHAGSPLIELRPGGGVSTGLTIQATSQVYALSINAFSDGMVVEANGTVLEGNYIGLRPNGSNSGNVTGVDLRSDNNTIGGTTLGARNVISDNVFGIELTGSSGNLIQGNYIGTNPAGTGPAGSQGTGIVTNILAGSDNNTVGGTIAAARNVISGNTGGGTGEGFLLTSGAPVGWVIQGNYVGVGADGVTAVPNDVGIAIAGSGHTIGGATPGARNVISRNLERGIVASGTGHVIEGNYLGVAADGVSPLGNGSGGVGDAAVRITGGDASISSNTIAYSAGDGIIVIGATTDAEIGGNAIFLNDGIAIDLNDDGVTANDAGDGDAGPNTLQNFPTVTTASTNASGTSVTLNLQTGGPIGVAILTVYASDSCDPSGFGEGQRLVGATIAFITTSSVSGTFNLTEAVSGGDVLTAQATFLGSSELGPCFTVPACGGGSPDCDGFTDAAPANHTGPANTTPTLDNCTGTWNQSQQNTDGNFVDNDPYATDDKTWIRSDAQGDACDPDDDNDGLDDVEEGGLPYGVCPTASGPTDPLLRDTDGDRFLDGGECALGFDPASASSKPALSACGPVGDTDGDRISDRIEVCNYNSNPSSVDSDGDVALDGAKDGCEVASINGDRAVNAGDQLLLAQEIVRVPPPAKLVNFDLNKDGSVSSGDQLLMAFFISPPGQCP
jgi:CSLREA domain-containing protein